MDNMPMRDSQDDHPTRFSECTVLAVSVHRQKMAQVLSKR